MVNQHYYSRYQRFIDSLKGQALDGYTEVHHIVPVSMGGSNDKDNLIALTARQHYVAHWMLARALGGSAARAFFMMSNFGRYGNVNSTTYEIARKEYAQQVSLQLKENPNTYVMTDEIRQKMRQSALGRKLSEATKAKISAAQVGRVYDDEFKRNVSEGLKGKATRGTGWSQSEETKRKIGDAQVGALNHRYGKKHTMETRIKMAEAHKRRANFKKEVLACAELQDADENVMTQEQANEFIATLP
jgi:hypothetical protein